MKRLTTDAITWTQDASGGWLRIKCDHPQQVLEDIQEGKLYDVEIKQHRERRSLDANAYMWVLLDKLADVLTVQKQRPISKVELYREMIPQIPGVSETYCGKTEAIGQLIRGWEHNGLGWVTETYPSKIPGCTNVILYSGSSVYDTKQMSRLIELIVAECKAQGIETLSPEQIASLEGMR